METTPMGQRFYREEADRLFPRGCSCPDKSGSCEWCQIYYEGDEELIAEKILQRAMDHGARIGPMSFSILMTCIAEAIFEVRNQSRG